MGKSRQTVGKCPKWCLFVAKSMTYALYTYQSGISIKQLYTKSVKSLYTCMANMLILQVSPARWRSFGSYQSEKVKRLYSIVV